ncbi:MAG: ABC transporter ATP-binding protein [Phycisphaerales bacterium]|nr:ABC transporter ATP-binding protein [Phycisphaerales bacterium]
MIQVCRLAKRFGGLTAVDGIDFEIPPGQTFGLLGPNGAGKTTTIHMLVGLLRPDGGEICIQGDSDPTRPAVRQHMGVAPQALSLYEDLTATENLAFFARLYGLRGRRLRERVAIALRRAGLFERRRDRVKTFSGGMKRRLHLACALVHEPSVLLLDEPTIGVDPQARHHILADIEALKQEGCTILFTTHYMEEAQRLCDRVAIMDHGRILVMDTVPNILAQHGGRAVVRAELDHPPTDPDSLPGHVEGDSVIVETDRPFEAVKQLAAAGVSIRNLSLHQPDLETVFLKLTGRRLRD